MSRIPPASITGEKIVTASEMARVETLAIGDRKHIAEEYMRQAAAGIYEIARNFIIEKGLDNRVVLVCARGNNSGDAYAVGQLFLENEVDVMAFQLAPLESCSSLCQHQADLFVERGGTIVFLEQVDDLTLADNCLIIDGLLGTGFHGEVRGLMRQVIEAMNYSPAPVIAIDIPSGVNGDTGSVATVAVEADITIYLGAVKVGHLFNQGFEYLGNLHGVSFGMEQRYLDKMEAFGHLVNPDIVSKNLPRHKRKANKYTVGQVMILAGSPGMPGAAILAASAAMRSGAGIVRLIHSPHMASELALLPPEVIRTPYDEELLLDELKRAKAFLIGPGLGRSDATRDILAKIIPQVTVPLVLDADALYFFDHYTISVPAILTPHRGELCRLLRADASTDDLTLVSLAAQFARTKNIVMVMKGAPTLIIAPDGRKVVIPYGNIGMASGGMGDALAGVITALVAQGKEVWEGAVLGATIHALAGDKAKEQKSPYSMIASDLIDNLFTIFQNSG